MALATIHVGQSLRSLTDPTWPIITVHSVHKNEERDGFAGHVLSPFAFVEWSDNLGVYTAMTLSTLQSAWEDTGI